jgi:hypothetical protein
VTLEVIIIAAIRICGSLPVLRWPLLGGLLAILVDLSDLLLRDLLDLGGVPDYQGLDKWLDQVYLGCFSAPSGVARPSLVQTARPPTGLPTGLGYDAARARSDGRRRDEGQTAWRKSARSWVGAIA